MTSNRIIFLYKNFAAATNTKISHIGLGVAAFNTSKTLIHNEIHAEIWPVVHHNEILPLIENDIKLDNKPITHFIISAPWIPINVLAELACIHKNINFVVISHSNVGFLAADRNGIKLLREGVLLQQYLKNFHIAGNSKKFTEWASLAWNTNITFLPNLYNIKDMVLQKKHWNGKDTLKIGCFGAIRPLKNQITAAAAAVSIAKKLDIPTELWFNSGRNEGSNFNSISTIEQLVGNIPGFIIKHKNWAPWDEFRTFIGKMDLNLQPSYTESYNMVVSDAIFESIPSVVSEAINWVPKNWIGNIDDANNLADVGIKLLHDTKAAKHGQKALKKYVDDGINEWKKFLSK